MRASTLLGIAIALFLGVAVVAGVRYSGLLDRTTVVAPKAEPFMVLVAKKNILKDTTLTKLDAVTRPATADEIREIIEPAKREKKILMPATVEAAQLMVAKESIMADTILFKADFLPLERPESVSVRLGAGFRAVELVLPKDRAAGGLLMKDELVDVLLTSSVCSEPACTQPRLATATIAKGLKIIVKRDSLYTEMKVPDEKPVSYILQANPYQAALIEFAKKKGELALQATRKEMMMPEDFEADKRADEYRRGEAPVSEIDLERIFRMQRTPDDRIEPPLLKIEHWVGARLAFISDISPPSGKGQSDSAGSGFSFHIPGQVTASPQASPAIQSGKDPYCPTCNKNKNKNK
jgi:Flp pilus assembly protein CpaB